MRCSLLLLVLLLMSCSSQAPLPKATLPSGWTLGDTELRYNLLPVVNGLPNDAAHAIYLSPGEKMVAEVIVVEKTIDKDRKSRWGLITDKMDDAYNKELQDRTTHVLGKEGEQSTLPMADGTTLDYHKVRITPGALAGKDVVWGLGHCEKKGQLLILNLGCLTDDYDASLVESLVSGLNWGP